MNNSFADYPRAPDLQLYSFRDQLKTILFAHYYAQRIKHTRDTLTMR